MIKKFFIIQTLLVFSSIGCVSKEPTIEAQAKTAMGRDNLDYALKLMDEEKYLEAIKVLKKITVETPAQEFDLVVLFNLGSAFEGKRDCRSALDFYRQVVAGASQRFPRIETISLLRMSYVYECLGENSKVVSSLLDLRKRIKFLHEDTAKAEVPARLAAAFARAGNRSEAEKYFKEALIGLKFLQVKYKDSTALGDKMAETLYFMGKSHLSDAEFKKSPVAMIRGFKFLQIYLLQSAELASPKWSTRAISEIMDSYRKISDLTAQLGVGEHRKLGEKLREKLREEVLIESLHSVRALRSQRMPGRLENNEIKRLFGFLDGEELRINNLMAQLGVSTELSEEAAARQGLRGQGRVSSAKETVLEKKAREKIRPTKKKSENK